MSEDAALLTASLVSVPTDKLADEIRRRTRNDPIYKVFDRDEIKDAAEAIGLLDEAREEGSRDGYEEAEAEAQADRERLEELDREDEDYSAALMRLRAGEIDQCLFEIGRALAQKPGFYAFHGLDATVARFYRG